MAAMAGPWHHLWEATTAGIDGKAYQPSKPSADLRKISGLRNLLRRNDGSRTIGLVFAEPDRHLDLSQSLVRW
jgi:hypothetical protein